MTDVIASYPIDLGTFPLYRGDGAGRNQVGIHLQDVNEDPVDLSLFGDEWEAQARSSYATNEAIDLDIDDTGAATGDLIVSIPDADSVALPRALVFDVQATGGGISPFTVFRGAFSTDPDVTR